MPDPESCTRARRSLQVDLRSDLKPARTSAEKFRLLPGREVPAFVDLVVVDELVIRPLCPTPRRLIVLAGKDAHGSRNGDVGGVKKLN